MSHSLAINQEVPLTDNPTRTLGNEKRWRSQFNKRFKALKGSVDRLFTNAPVVDVEFVTFFNQWLASEMEQIIFDSGATAATIWQNQFIEKAFGKGLIDSMGALSKEGFTTSAFTTQNVNTLRLTKEKLFQSLRGITNEVSAQAGFRLAGGIEEGRSKEELAAIVNDRIDKIGRTRSHTMVNTGNVEAYNNAQINQAEQIEAETGEEVRMLWVTRQDKRVRTTHALRNMRLFSTTAARRLIGEPNCRCGLRIQVGEGTAGERKARKKIRTRGLAKSEQGQQERRFFTTIERKAGAG